MRGTGVGAGTHFELRASLIFDGMMTGLEGLILRHPVDWAGGAVSTLALHTEVEPALITPAKPIIAAPAQTSGCCPPYCVSAVPCDRSPQPARCRLAAGANRLTPCNRLVQLNSSSLGRDGHFPVVQMDGVDVSEYLVRAAHAFQSERYLQAGLTLASLLIHTTSQSEEEAGEAIGNDRAFAGFDAYGKLLSEEDAKEHWRERRAERLKQLDQKIDGLANAPKPELQEMPREDDDYRSECCCCWARPAEGVERSAHSAHVR